MCVVAVAISLLLISDVRCGYRFLASKPLSISITINIISCRAIWRDLMPSGPTNWGTNADIALKGNTLLFTLASRTSNSPWVLNVADC